MITPKKGKHLKETALKHYEAMGRLALSDIFTPPVESAVGFDLESLIQQMESVGEGLDDWDFVKNQCQ
jgi:hypothetical protein